MVSLITKVKGERKFYISSGWKRSKAIVATRGYNVDNNKYGFATILTKAQASRVRKLRPVTIAQIRRIKRKY